MKRVVVIREFKDAKHGEVLRSVGLTMILEDDRAEELLQKNVVIEELEINLLETKPVDEEIQEDNEDKEDVKEDGKTKKPPKEK